jgi:uncharacterized damage-inducible protein DinB
MAIKDSILPEFDHEMRVTRSLLAVVPEAKAEWKPHERSMSMGQLALHLANLLQWAVLSLEAAEYDMDAGNSAATQERKFESTTNLLATFDENVQQARAKIDQAGDADLMAPWTLKKGVKAYFTMPKVAVLRSFVMNHGIHHRGQLSVYLRLNDVPLPNIYGPTADNPM